MLAVSATALFATTAALQTMTLEEKVGQIMMVHFQGEHFNEEARVRIENLHVGGIIYYNWANGLRSFEQVRTLSAGLQERSHLPLLIAVDQEGGRVQSLREGFSKMPSARELASDTHPDLARRVALVMGQQMMAAGVNTNLAPVVDIDSNPNNPIIGPRSFGDTASIVAAFARKTIEGYHQAGVFTTLKHFPGHGDTATDSHLDLPLVDKPRGELYEGELAPFKELAPTSELVMTAHLMVPALDPIHCSTLSKPTLDILREGMGFQGVILTDSLVMEGVLKQAGSVSNAALLALNAGCDMLLFGGKQLTGSGWELTTRDLQEIHAFLVGAVKAGQIAEERLNEAVERILKLKAKLRR